MVRNTISDIDLHFSVGDRDDITRVQDCLFRLKLVY